MVKNVVTVGGGTGSYTILKGLKKYDDINITAIVSMADDGGSTGKLRDELGVLPPGDVRQCLVALSEHTDTVRKLINYRFEDGSLKGHSFGNIFLAALEKVAGSFVKGVGVAGEILKIKGSVVPVTEDTATLSIKLKDGKTLVGEDSINHGHIQTAGVEEVYFTQDIKINPYAVAALLNADLIILGPGNLYCAILPNLVVPGFKEALVSSKAKIVVPVNLTNKKGHTEHWKSSDYIREIEKAIGKNVDFILVNTTSPSAEQIELYQLEEGSGVMIHNDIEDERAREFDLLSHQMTEFSNADEIATTRSFIRHDSDKLAEAVLSLLK